MKTNPIKINSQLKCLKDNTLRIFLLLYVVIFLVHSTTFNEGISMEDLEFINKTETTLEKLEKEPNNLFLKSWIHYRYKLW